MQKTISFAALHMTVAFAVGYAMTGDVLVGGALALVEPLCNSVAYYFHERWWTRHPSRDGACTVSRLSPRIDSIREPIACRD